MSNNNRNQPVIPPIVIPPQARSGPDPVFSNEAIMSDAGIDPLELAAANAPVTTGAETLEELQRALLVAQLRSANLINAREEREEGKRSESERVAKAARDNNIAEIRKQIARKTAERDGCPHQKPNNRGSAIAGTRDHQGHYHFLCQYCQKEWTDNELPPHLRIDSDFIGGPTIGALVF